jgi:hypothetical protein
VSHFVYIIDEIGRNTFECFSQTVKVGAGIFGRDPESPLFCRELRARFDAWISIKRMPDRIRIHRLSASFGDVIDETVHHPRPGTGLRVNVGIDEGIILFLVENWW